MLTGMPKHEPVGSSDLAPEGDHAFAAWAARTAGDALVEVRSGDLEGAELKDAADLASHELLMGLFRRHRPDDAVLSEEEHRGTASAHPRSTAERVWIVDPLDGTREFSEPARDDWAVHVALWSRSAGPEGDLVTGAVALPALGRTYATPSVALAGRPEGPPRIAVSRTRPPDFVRTLGERIGAEFVPMGSAGAKVISVVRGVSDAYVHAGGQFEWDSAAPVAVARAAGLHASRIDGSPLRYNRTDVSLPDLLVCRPEYADTLLSAISGL